MIVISEPKLPKTLKVMRPELLTLDAGFSESNYEVMLGAVKKLANSKAPQRVKELIEGDEEPDFYGFFDLYDYLITKDRRARLLLPELGYSPYNFLLLINCLGQDKRQMAKLLNCSFSKISVNTAVRSSDHFMPMVGRQWQDFLEYFMETLEVSDKQHGIERDYENVFYMLGDRKKALKLPI